MKPTLKAIETVYKGYRFRSRLEARWAIFFDNLGVAWEYEKEGFELSRGRRYLPDFYLNDWEMWCEIKPKDISHDDAMKVQDFVIEKRTTLLLINGSPWSYEYELTLMTTDMDINGPCVAGQFCRCRDCDGISLLFGEEGEYYADIPVGKHTGEHSDRWAVTGDTKIHQSFVAARSARFEHGEAS